jgi:hypothetical protein
MFLLLLDKGLKEVGEIVKLYKGILKMKVIIEKIVLIALFLLWKIPKIYY